MTSQALNRPVDVPAVLQKMDAAIGSMQMFHLGTGAMEEARAAVSELIEALSDCVVDMQTTEDYYGNHPRAQEVIARAKAALAAVEGQP